MSCTGRHKRPERTLFQIPMRGNENVLLAGPTDSGKTPHDASMNWLGVCWLWKPMSRSKRPFRERSGRHAIPEDHHPQPQGNARLSEKKTIVKDKTSAEEREILDGFERGELRSWS